MAEKPKYVAVLEWNEDDRDFFQVEKTNEDVIYAIIDEEQNKVFLHFPQKTKLVARRTVERRVKSIAKSGFEIPELNIRIGTGFKIVETGSDTVIPDILLQVGHEYVGMNEQVETSAIKMKESKTIMETPTIKEQTRATVTETESRPPPRTPGKRRKKHMVKPTFSGSPIRIKEVEEGEEDEEKGEIAGREPAAALQQTVAAEGIDPDTLGLGAILRTAMELFGSAYIAKKGENSFIMESDSNLIEFKLYNGKPEFLRTMKSTKSSIKLDEFEKRLGKFL